MYINSGTLQYPVTEQMIRDAYPDTSFPSPFVPPAPYAWVFPTPQPSYDWITQGVREIAPVFTSPNWYQVWEVYALTPQQIADNEELNKSNFLRDAKTNMMAYLDTFAQTRDYRDADRCVSYVGSAFLQANADATYVKSARDDVLDAAFAVMDPVATGANPVPTMEAFMAALPPLAWPHIEAHPAVGGTPVL